MNYLSRVQASRLPPLHALHYTHDSIFLRCNTGEYKDLMKHEIEVFCKRRTFENYLSFQRDEIAHTLYAAFLSCACAHKTHP